MCPLDKAIKRYHSKDNLLTSDPERYARYIQIFEQYPDAQLGAPSIGWLQEALAVCAQLQQQSQLLQMPCLLLQASAEKIVSNRAQAQFAAKQPQAELLSIPRARHQILLDQDACRTQAMQAIVGFFQRYIKTDLHQR